MQRESLSSMRTIRRYGSSQSSIERYYLTPAAKQYNLEHGSMTTPWHHIFTKAVRLEAAEVMARRYSAEFKLGNYW